MMNNDRSTDLLDCAIGDAVRDPALHEIIKKHVLRHIRERMGGETHYIRRPGKEDRDHKIRMDHELGLNPTKLCDKYNICRTQIYTILKDEK